MQTHPEPRSPPPTAADSGGGNGTFIGLCPKPLRGKNDRAQEPRGGRRPTRPPCAALGNGGAKQAGGRRPQIAGRGWRVPRLTAPPTPADSGRGEGGSRAPRSAIATPPANIVASLLRAAPLFMAGGHIPPNPLLRSGFSLRRPGTARGIAGRHRPPCLPPSLRRPQRETRGNLGARIRSPRRLWHLGVISADYRRASPGAAAVPSHAHRGLVSAHAGIPAVPGVWPFFKSGPLWEGPFSGCLEQSAQREDQFLRLRVCGRMCREPPETLRA